MSTYWVAVNHTKRQKVDPEAVGSGGIKEHDCGNRVFVVGDRRGWRRQVERLDRRARDVGPRLELRQVFQVAIGDHRHVVALPIVHHQEREQVRHATVHDLVAARATR